MCLTLDLFSKKLIAKKDKIVYKFIRNANSLNKSIIHNIKDGSKFKGVINEIQCSGRIHKVGNNIWLCTNDPRLNYRYNYVDIKILPWDYQSAWAFDNLVTSIIINGVEHITYKKELLTPFRGKRVKIGSTYFSPISVKKGKIDQGLHSFKTFKAAKKAKINDSIFAQYSIVKCIIPKGSTYYRGWFEGKVSYASNTIKYIEIIENGKK